MAGIFSFHSGRTRLASSMNGESSSPSKTSAARSARTIGANGLKAWRGLTPGVRKSFTAAWGGAAGWGGGAGVRGCARTELGTPLEPADDSFLGEPLRGFGGDIVLRRFARLH